MTITQTTACPMPYRKWFSNGMKHNLNIANAIPVKCIVASILNFINICANVWQRSALSSGAVCYQYIKFRIYFFK